MTFHNSGCILSKFITLSGVGLVLLGLTACSSHVSAQWDCPAQKGMSCVTIAGADKEAVRKVEKQAAIENIEERVTQTNAVRAAHSTNEDHFSVWFAPYTDKVGHYHEASVIHNHVLKENSDAP